MENDTNVKNTGVLDRVHAGYVVNDRYEITGRLGAGGFAVVFLGRDLQIERDVAIKVMSTRETVTDPKVREQLLKRFRREASLAGRIDHPNVLNIYDYGVIDDEGDPFIVMERLEGHDLETQLFQQGAMKPDHIVPLFVDTLVALGVAHEHGIVHKDLKPSNLFLKRPGTRLESLCILDFGIAHIEREVRSRLTQAGQLMGTPAYLPPEYSTEQIVTPMLDVYQMGLILVETMTGSSVVQHSEPMAAMFQHVRGKLEVPRLLLESPLGPVLERALALDHKERFENGLEFADALAAIDTSSIPVLKGEIELVPFQRVDGGGEGEGSTSKGAISDGVEEGGKAQDRPDSSTRIVYGGASNLSGEQDSALMVEENQEQTPARGRLKAVDAVGPEPLPAVTPELAPDDAEPSGDREHDSGADLSESGPQLDSRFSSETADPGAMPTQDMTMEMDQPGSSRGLLVLVILLAVGVLAGAGLWMAGVFDGEVEDTSEKAAAVDDDGGGESDEDAVALTGDGDEDGEGEETEGGAGEEEEEKAVKVAISSEPSGATIYRGEEELGTTPFDLEVGEGESVEAVVVLEDFEEKTVTISAEGESELFFELTPAARPQETAGVGAGASPRPGTPQAGASPGTGRQDSEEETVADTTSDDSGSDRQASAEVPDEESGEQDEDTVEEEEVVEEEEEEEGIRLPGF